MPNRLVLMHGAPGAGKSTFIKNRDLDHLVISPDNLRLLFSAPIKEKIGRYWFWQISQKKNREVWQLAFRLLEERLQNGSDTIFDACNFTQDYLTRYKRMADLYGFRTVVLDFSKMPLKKVMAQNRGRLYQDHGLRYVPENVIRDIYQKMEPVPDDMESIDVTKEGAVAAFWNWWNNDKHIEQERKG